MAEHGGFGRESVVARVDDGTLTSHGDPGSVDVPEPQRPEDKYEVSATIGAGGMGEVLLVKDRDLRREVAMKVMKRDRSGSGGHRVKFVSEAQATAQLDHPGIPPVHDLGTTEDGAPWFTMKLVRGRTLREVLHHLLLNRKGVREEFTLHRLVTILERMCEALHFAHEKGVLHRDLKPENIMLGDYGEVHIMDWGIARVRGETVHEADRVDTDGTDAGLETLDGAVKGTIPYMSPEQAEGRVSDMDRRSDVWALGCILYEVLTLHLAFDGDDVLARVRRGDFPPVRTRNPKRAVPEELARLCEQCLRREPEERIASARDLGESLRRWLDGSAERLRRHEEAEALAEKGRAAAARYAALKDEVVAAEEAADTEATKYESWQPVEECLPMLEAREAVGEKRRQMLRAFAESTKWLEAAIVAEEGNATARAALGELWRGRLADAEKAGDTEDAGFALDMMARYDDGDLARVITGDGSLYLASEPPGAEVILHRFEDRHGILHEGEGVPLGQTPIGPKSLPMGSYLCILRLPGFRDVRYPVHITRNRSWNGCVKMRTDEEIGEGFVYVPGGPFVYGEGQKAATRELPDFAIAEYPVTFGDWAEYLVWMEQADGLDAALKRIPDVAGVGKMMDRSDDGIYRPLPELVEGAARERCRVEHGEDFGLRVPVLGVTWHDAVHYCAWQEKTTGREHRLPSAMEREKAARGVDGRVFPWGDLEHATLANCIGSRDEIHQPEPVGTFATARSVYGMGDAAGNASDWTVTWRDKRKSARVLLGGGWGFRPSRLGCASWSSGIPEKGYPSSAFRCARGLL